MNTSKKVASRYFLARREVSVAQRYMMAKAKTFPQAKEEILKYLQTKGWKVVPNLKVPHATNPEGDLRVWFKPQTVYYTKGNNHTLGGARTVSYNFDIRQMDGPKFVSEVERLLANE